MNLLPEQSMVFNAFAALVGMTPGKDAYGIHTAYIASHGTAGYRAALNAEFASMSDAQLGRAMLANLCLDQVFTDADAEAYLARNAGDRAGAVLDLAGALAGYGGADAAIVEARDAYELRIQWSHDRTLADGPLAPLPGSFPGNTIILTTALDTLGGSAADDLFQADLAGGSNTLNSGDGLSGGAGIDTLKATVVSGGPGAVGAVSTSIENLSISAQKGTAIIDNPLGDYAVEIDGHRMSGVAYWEDRQSGTDLVVEDLRIGDDQSTGDITIAMVETAPGDVDYGVYLDPYSLRAGSSATSVLRLELLNTHSAGGGSSPLKDHPYWGFRFLLNGTPQVVASFAINDAGSAQTDTLAAYTEFANALSARIAELVAAGNTALSGLTVSLGDEFQRYDTMTGELVTGIAILLTDTKGGVLGVDSSGAWEMPPGCVVYDNTVHTRIEPYYDSAPPVESVCSKVVLDDVGRGSTGGDLVIGSLSTGDIFGHKGVERFEIEVRDNSRLQTIQSTNNTLREVVIVNGVTTSHVVDPKHTGVATDQNAGDLYVNGPNNADTALPGTTNTAGFTDVRLIDGSAMTGSLSMTANITNASIAKYLNLAGTAAIPYGDNIPFVYSGGTNNDSLSVTIDSALIGSTGTLGAREDFTFTLNGNAGNDALTVSIDGSTSANWYTDQAMLNNVAINGGEGNDAIRKPGSGDVVINAGAGNDAVYSDNSGKGASAFNDGRAVWVVSAANTDIAQLQGVAANDANHFLYGGKLTVAFSTTTANANISGWEATVDIPIGTNGAVNQHSLNQAIKTAIDDDAVLGKLLVAVDGPDNTLAIGCLVDGGFAAAALDMRVSAPDVATLGASEQESVLAAYRAFAHDAAATIGDASAAQAAGVAGLNAHEGVDSAILATTGKNSSAKTDNVIDLGAGDDLLVLSTSADANETIVFDGYALGRDTIVNFQDGVAAGSDKLDFTAYLDCRVALLGWDFSQPPIEIRFGTDATTQVNEVTILDSAAFTSAQSFAGLTAEKLLAAIDSANAGAADYAGISAATLNAEHGYGSLVGMGKAVVMIENDANKGEYAVVDLSFDGTTANTNADYTAAQLIGVLDFGASLSGFGIGNLVA